MSCKIFSSAFLAMVLLSGCGGETEEQTTGLFDGSGPGGQGGAGAGSGGNAGGMGGEGASSTTSTNTGPLTYEEELEAECTGGCHHAAEVSMEDGCAVSPTCVEDCVDYGMLPEIQKCGDEYLAILKCAQVEDTAATCHCGGDGTLACQVCDAENNDFQNCQGFGF